MEPGDAVPLFATIALLSFDFVDTFDRERCVCTCVHEGVEDAEMQRSKDPGEKRLVSCVAFCTIRYPSEDAPFSPV